MTHLALVGPTASGKSAVAMAVARALGDVEIVAVDAMQVYEGMDVGTAKPTPSDRAEVPHHLLDLVEASEPYSVAQYQRAAVEILAGIEARGHRALLVAGTGLYLRAVIDALELPGTFPELRRELEAAAADGAAARLHERLSAADPRAAARIAPTNARRVVRALEVTLGAGRPFSSFGPGLATHPTVGFSLAGVWLPRRVVAERIAHRFRAQLEQGLVAEVEALAGRPGGLSATAGRALGYREVLEHLAGRMSLEDAVTRAVGRTRAFARRQRVWFRRDPRITWLASARNPLAVVPVLLGHWSRPWLSADHHRPPPAVLPGRS